MNNHFRVWKEYDKVRAAKAKEEYEKSKKDGAILLVIVILHSTFAGVVLYNIF